MANLWDNPGIHHKGWTCVDVHDLGDAVGSCAMCGKEEIRFQHEMQHPGHDAPLLVGCVCAGKMEASPAAARRREGTFKAWARRRAAFLALHWLADRPGVDLLLLRRGREAVRVELHDRGGLTTVRVHLSATGWIGGRRWFASKESAKDAVFGYLYPRPTRAPGGVP